MVTRMVPMLVCAMALAGDAAAQEPYNLTAPVRSLATLFTDLYWAQGLVLDSLATLPGEQPHTAHFASDFQANFSQFNAALVSQLVSVPLGSYAGQGVDLQHLTRFELVWEGAAFADTVDLDDIELAP